MSTRKQMNSTIKSAKKYSSYFGGDSDGENGNMSGGEDPEVDYEEYESEAEEDSVDGDKKSKPAEGDEEGVDVIGDDDSVAEDDESEEEDGNDEEPGEDVEDLDAPIDTEDEDDDDESEDGEDEEQGEEEGNDALRPYARKPVPARNRKPVQNQVNVYSKSDDSEGDDDEDEDENYLQKFNAEINKEYIVDYHPECIIGNYDEIATLAVVVRDKNNNIVDDLHRTPPYLTKYERARILGQRAKQINAGAPIYVKPNEKINDGYIIAETELKNKMIPFIIRRPLPNGGSEYWKVNDLENVAF